MNNLAKILVKQGRYDEAEPLYRRAMAISEKALDPNHPNMALVLHNMSELYRLRGQLAEAEPLARRSLAACNDRGVTENRLVAACTRNLAELFLAQGRWDEAESFSRESLLMREKVFGPDHPDVAESLLTHAAVLRGLGRNAEAGSMDESARRILTQLGMAGSSSS